MKALGVKPGFPDLIMPISNGIAPGLVIEMKSDIGRTSTTQNEWIEMFQAQGWDFRLARSAQEARSYLCLYLGINPDAAPELSD